MLRPIAIASTADPVSAAEGEGAAGWGHSLLSDLLLANDSLPVIGLTLQAVGAKLAASLLAPTAFTFAADLVGGAEGAGAGLRWGDLWKGPFPVGASLSLMLVDAALYSALAWCVYRPSRRWLACWVDYRSFDGKGKAGQGFNVAKRIMLFTVNM